MKTVCSMNSLIHMSALRQLCNFFLAATWIFMLAANSPAADHPVVEVPNSKAARRKGNEAVHRGDLQHRSQVRHGADSRRQVHDGKPGERKRPQGRRRPAARSAKSSRSGWASAKSPGTSTKCSCSTLDIQRRKCCMKPTDRQRQAGRRRHPAHQALHRHDLRHGQGRLSRRSA